VPGTTTTTVAAQPGPTTGAGMPAPSPHATRPPGQPVTTVASAAVPRASTRVDGPPGSAAPLYLRPQPATSIVIEVSSADGAAPSQATLDHVTAVVHDASGKPVSVRAGSPPPAHDAWTADDVRAAADATTVVPQGGDRAVLHLLFVRGRWADDENVLGISVRGDVAAVFEDQIAGAADPLVGPGAIEVSVTTHEVGHLLGLVDLYLNTGRHDPQHPGHSTNKGSVMYWAVESTLVTDLLTGGPPRDLDDADRADLAAIRGGA
jgi:hypothetical protein